MSVFVGPGPSYDEDNSLVNRAKQYATAVRCNDDRIKNIKSLEALVEERAADKRATVTEVKTLADLQKRGMKGIAGELIEEDFTKMENNISRLNTCKPAVVRELENIKARIATQKPDGTLDVTIEDLEEEIGRLKKNRMLTKGRAPAPEEVATDI